jgi:peptidoglycan-associated lipoprotein
MRIATLFIPFLCSLLACGTSQQISAQSEPLAIHEYSSLHGKSELKNVPIMHFDKREFDLGTVKKGEKRTLKYNFTNKGDTPLSISLISACECTTTNFDDLRGKEWQPGESGTIVAVFDSSEKDYGELIDIEIILDQVEPGPDEIPIFEKLYYSFEIEK